MQYFNIKIICLTIIVGLTSCGSPSSDDQTASDSEQHPAKPRTPTLLDAQIDSLRKAENVEDMLLKANEARKHQTEEL